MEIEIIYLQAELARIDIMIRREVRRWQVAGQNPNDSFRGLVVSDHEADTLAHMPMGGNWGQLVCLPEDEELRYIEALAQADQTINGIRAEAKIAGKKLRLDALVEAFDLTRQDLNTLLICLAPALDLRYERLYGYLQDDVTRKQPSLSLIMHLLCPTGDERWQYQARFDDQHRLFQNFLIEPSSEESSGWQSQLGKPLQIDATVTGWLLGRYQPGPRLAEFVTYLEPVDAPSDRILVNVTDNRVNPRAFAETIKAQMPIVVFYGPDPGAQEAAARQFAWQHKRNLLRVDLSAAIRDRAPLLEIARRVLRDARLTGAIPFFCGWDALLTQRQGEQTGAPGSDAPDRGSPTEEILPNILSEICRHPGAVIIAGHSAWQVTGIERQKPVYWLEFSAPNYQQRLALWQHFIEVLTCAELDVELDLILPAGQFSLLGGQIRDAVASAVDSARQANRKLETRDLVIAARRRASSYLGALAVKIEPRYSWQDLILPEDQLKMLHEIGSTVKSRALVLEEWEVGRKLVSSYGIPILFSGPPGTGKTMAAEVIARDLELDLYKIDLSTVVSKYIGETEKNLERIFEEAESGNAILFFDEADAIFGKRSEVKDAHDRYANIEVSYLLQRMERYNGVTILATNLRANLDDAFSRRLQFAVDFPFPDERHRKAIWMTLFPAKVPRDENLDFEMLARRFRMAGGNIRNILVSAAYQAAADGHRVTMDHLLHGVRREMQKMGRLVNENDLAQK